MSQKAGAKATEDAQKRIEKARNFVVECERAPEGSRKRNKLADAKEDVSLAEQHFENVKRTYWPLR